MEITNFEMSLQSVASGGNVLNIQELTGVQSGLRLLKAREKAPELFFWGKIFGTAADYYVAFALQGPDFEFPSKNFYYAGEDFEFKPLQRLTEDVADRIIELALDKPFTGVASTLLEPAAEGEEPPADEGEAPAEDTGKPAKLKETDRLAQLVQDIDFDTAVVPKGAHALSEVHKVVASTDFKGLGITEAASLKSYVHFRPPTSVAALRALARTDIQFFSNFLDPIEGDLPKGCWAVRQDPSAMLVTLRSLSWPGYVAYHTPATPAFGGMYFGYGQKCRDLPFII